MRHTVLRRRPLHGFIFATLAAGLLAGCQTDGGPTDPFTELAAYHARNQAPSTAPDRPKSRAQAAMDCWALAEKSQPSANLDAKGDFVNNCIDARMHPDAARAASPDPMGRPVKPKTAGKPKPDPGAKPPS